jgi:hypothetical protein
LSESLYVKPDDQLSITISSINTDETNAPTIWLIGNQSSNGKAIPAATAGEESLPGSFSMHLDYSYIDYFSIGISVLLFIFSLVFFSLAASTERD